MATHLLVRLAAVCPSDPFDGFWAWMGCSVLKAFGADPDKLRGDLVFQLLSNPSSPSASGCPSMLESFLGPSQSCLTEQLWQLMEPAGYLLIVAVLGARFAKMMASNNFSVSPGWALADPVLRSVVAGTFVHLSYGVMVLGHSGLESVGVLLFEKITAAGGVTGAWILDPAGASAGLSGGALLVDIIHWLFSLYVLVMVLASLVGFQVCIVLAPLVIPLWIFSGQNQVFAWFTKTVIGATILPVVVGVGWAVFLDMIHQFSVTQTSSVINIFAGWVMELVFVIAGVWFMTRFIKATTAEVFASQNLLTTIFLMESVGHMTGRMVGRVAPQAMVNAFASAPGVQRLAARGLLPHRMTQFVNAHNNAQMGLVGQVGSWMQVNSQARKLAAGLMTPSQVQAGADIVWNNGIASLRVGNYSGNDSSAAAIVQDFSQARYEKVAWEGFRRLPMAEQIRVASGVVAHMYTAGLDQPRIDPLQARGEANLLATFAPGTHIGRYLPDAQAIIKSQTPGPAVPDTNGRITPKTSPPPIPPPAPRPPPVPRP